MLTKKSRPICCSPDSGKMIVKALNLTSQVDPPAKLLVMQSQQHAFETRKAFFGLGTWTPFLYHCLTPLSCLRTSFVACTY